MLEIRLTENQWARISEILGNFGLLMIGSIVVPALFDRVNIITVILGLSTTVGFLYASIAAAVKY